MGHQTTSMFEMDTFVHVYVYYTAVTQSWHNFGMAALGSLRHRSWKF